MNISRDVKRKFFCALKGYFFWRNIAHQYKAEDIIAVFFPTENEEVNKSGLKYIDKLILATNKKCALILSCNNEMRNYCSEYSANIVNVIFLTEEQKQNLLAACSLIALDNRLFIASLSHPFGRSADKLIGKRGTTIDQAMKYGVFYLPRQVDKRFKSKRTI